jgi:predicted kinase
MSKQLFLIRGLPGSCKTTFAKTLNPTSHIEADMFFEHPIRGYEFDASKLKDAHEWCKKATEDALSYAYHRDEDSRIVVSNTFTTEGEIAPYVWLAIKYDHRLVTIVVENRHGNVSVHNVPSETMDKMKNRFQIKLL